MLERLHFVLGGCVGEGAIIIIKSQRTHELTNSLFPEYEQRTLYGAVVVTLANLLRLISCRFIIIIIIIIIVINICE